jgi:seryl-tRNA synthetase
MLDIKAIRENPDFFKKALARKGVESSQIDELLSVDKAHRESLQKAEALKHQQNEASKKIPTLSGTEKETILGEMKTLSEEKKKLEEVLEQNSIEQILCSMPNTPFDDVPMGKTEDDNKVMEAFGTRPKFDFKIRDHVEIGELTDTIDIETARQTSGSRFAVLKGKGALLEWALQRFVLEKLMKEEFTPVIPPMMIRGQTVHEAGKSAGTLEHALEAPEKFTFPEDDLSMVGTAEHVLCSFHREECLAQETLPVKYCGWSSCFRREAGAAGKDTRGIIRVHQFEKLEMFLFVDPEKSKEEHQKILKLQRSIWDDLGIPYQVVENCTGDIAWSDAQMYDIEAWLPSQDTYREVTSCSNCTDFQSRRTKTKFKTKDGEKNLVHTLNATAIAIQRAIVAIYENFQNADGSVNIPEALQPYCGFKKIEVK